MRAPLLVVLLSFLVSFAVPVQANLAVPAQADLARVEVWAYVDAQGVAHFAHERVDDRYELFYRGGASFDTRESKPTPELIETPRPVAVPREPPKLIAFFEVAPRFKQIKHHLRDAAQAHNIDYELLQALIATESGFDTDAVSPKGAVGLMQIMPATAERYGVASDAKLPVEKKLTDPKTNIRTGTRYLRDLFNMFPGRLDLALAAYNAGEGAVQRAGNRIPNYKETQNYVKTVMQIYTALKPPTPIVERQQIQRREPRAVSAPPANLPGLPGFHSASAPGSAAGGVAAPVGGAVGRGNMPASAGAPRLHLNTGKPQ